MLDDGQTQSRSSGFLRTALVHAEEAFEHLVVQLGRDARSRVADAHDRLVRGVHEPAFHAFGAHLHGDEAAFVVVADAVLDEVVQHLLGQRLAAGGPGPAAQDERERTLMSLPEDRKAVSRPSLL